jgi:hypothetical protein
MSLRDISVRNGERLAARAVPDCGRDRGEANVGSMRMGILIVGWALSGLGCSDDGGDDGETASEQNANRGDTTGCPAFCARSLECANDPAPDCVSSCQLSARLCPTQSAAMLACAQDKPDSDFHCDPTVEVTTINADVCSSESDALVDCVIDAAL